VWAGYTYEWDEAQTDATLLEFGKTVDIDGQQWQFPSPFHCIYCHAPSAGDSIGLEVAQLNSDLEYTATGVVANQLTTLESIGLVSAPRPAPVEQLPALIDPKAGAGSIDDRARAYLHANCGYCHRPGGNGRGPEDFRYWTEGPSMGAWNVAPTRGNLGISDALLLFPGVPEKSVLLLRMETLDGNRMPVIGSLMVDDAGVAVINAWIDSGLGFDIPDTDGDGFADNVDNCSADTNPDQIDSDGDGFGNGCDPDLNNDSVINFIDLGLLKERFFTTDADADFNGDGNVNFIDLVIMKARFFGAPGPGAVTD
ncbi:MAG: dockerin type I domain-containing protein, partial [Pseudomonadota bacterium]